MSNSYSKPLIRFWWIVLLGALIAGVAAVAVIDRELNARTYTATARLLVTSPEAPYYRISTTQVVDDPSQIVPGSGTSTTGEGEESSTEAAQRAFLYTNTPDQRSLLAAANLYPLLIEGDQVASLRSDMFGALPGELTARAIFAVATQGRFEPSDVPVVELIAEADRRADAIRLAQATSNAFIEYITQQQDAANLTPRERIVIQPLLTPATAEPSGTAPIALAGIVLLAVWAAFIALAVALDRLFPKRRRQAAAAAQKAAPVEHGERPAEATKP